ncbi:MAG: UDP-3-O-acyl-N-acetylglucosamine deacetylase [Desulfobulbaceae bacterium]|nr:UDP-3-O-acyl-N-acetylglucosamine deacetylase [Desulfobulbaceae bacterium]HIJ79092.1 UDP-3-O-acyl-N-acetylglucosamine deacetylase [Deltaproteobacteria bacterium]
MSSFQHTIKKTIRFRGIGLHSGKPVTLTILPAEVNSGIRFVRSDMNQEAPTPAFMDRIIDTRLATTIGTEDDAPISTTEHLLAALVGMGVDNAIVEIDGPEVPIMDGSAGPFVHVLKKIGRSRQNASRWMLKILKEISYQDGDTYVKILPHNGFKVTCEIDFDHAFIRKQTYSANINPKKFAQELAAARTFGFLDQVEMLRQNGLALGGSLDNAIVIDETGVVNADGLRFADEFARHKALDLIGDLALLGFPLLGHVMARKSGHGHHFALMQQLAAQPDRWDLVTYEKEGENRVLEKVASTTREAGDMLLSYLVPPSVALAGEPCMA